MKKPAMALFALLTVTAAFSEGDASSPATAAAERMRELHLILYDTKASPEERRAAREELLRLLRSNGAKVPPREMPPRAAIIPTPNAVIGTQRDAPAVTVAPSLAPTSPLASPTNNPGTGGMLVPSGRTAIDSRTGRVVNEVPGGYLDPATGRFTPKP